MNEEQARKFAESVELPAPFDDWPEFHQHAMGCGIEDRDITDRYEAAEYGWNECEKRTHEQGPFYAEYQVREAIAAALVKAGQKTVLECLQEMPEEQRLDVFSSFCTHCGTNNPRCQCWNDE